MRDPQTASDYNDRTTEVVKSVLVEIGQILGSYEGKFVLIGGLVPRLSLEFADMKHAGSADIDLALDTTALEDGEYASLVRELLSNGYRQDSKLRYFQLCRDVDLDGAKAPVEVIIDFLMPRNARIGKRQEPLIEYFAVQRAHGADLAIDFNELIKVTANMPTGGKNTVQIAVCSIPALLAMKGYALKGRQKYKDAYDIYYCVRNYPGGVDNLANDCGPVLKTRSGSQGYEHINEKFDTLDGLGPTNVRNFVKESHILGGRTPDQWQLDAFTRLDDLMRAIGLRK